MLTVLINRSGVGVGDDVYVLDTSNLLLMPTGLGVRYIEISFSTHCIREWIAIWMAEDKLEDLSHGLKEILKSSVCVRVCAQSKCEFTYPVSIMV